MDDQLVLAKWNTVLKTFCNAIVKYHEIAKS